MALKDLFARFKADAADRFNMKKYDPSAGRRALLRGIDQAKEQFGSGRTKVPNRTWTVQNDVVAYSPKLNGTPLVLNGLTTNHIEADEFPAFLDELRALVEAGELDKEIEQIESGGGNAGSSVAVQPETARAPGSRKPMSEETKAKLRRSALAREAARKSAGK